MDYALPTVQSATEDNSQSLRKETNRTSIPPISQYQSKDAADSTTCTLTSWKLTHSSHCFTSYSCKSQQVTTYHEMSFTLLYFSCFFSSHLYICSHIMHIMFPPLMKNKGRGEPSKKGNHRVKKKTEKMVWLPWVMPYISTGICSLKS